MEIFLSLELDPVRRSINILSYVSYISDPFFSSFTFAIISLLGQPIFLSLFSYLHFGNRFFLVKVLAVP